ncbi:MAG: peptidoglycan-binding protein LysM [Gemmatimonadales bacterium]
MGLFDFMKGAGRKDEEDELQEQVDEAIKGNKLKGYVDGLGFDVENIKVKFDDGVATVWGKAATQEEREKVVLALGNTRGVGQVDDQMEVVQAAAAAKFYTVAKGDSLSKMAKEFYGDYKQYPTIFEANRPMLEHPDKIYPGQVLRIPTLG